MSVRRISTALFLGMTVSVAAVVPATQAVAATPAASTTSSTAAFGVSRWVYFGTYTYLEQCIDDLEMLIHSGRAKQASCTYKSGKYILEYLLEYRPELRGVPMAGAA